MSQSFGQSGARQPLTAGRLPDEWRREDAAGSALCGAAWGALPGMPDAPGTAGAGWSGVRAAFEASAAGMTPARAARHRQLAQFLGMPEAVIREQPEMAEMEYRARLVEQKPRLAGWIGRDMRKAALVYDEPESLLELFDALEEEGAAGAADEADAADAADELARRVREGRELARKMREGDEEARAELLRRQGWTEDEIRYGRIEQGQGPGPVAQIPILLREGADQVGKGLAGAVVMLAENLQSRDGTGAADPYLKTLARDVRQSLEEHERSRPAPLRAESAAGRYAQDLVRMVPQVAAQLGVTHATGGLGGAAFMGSQIAGSQYLELTEKEVERGRALLAALANAGLQAPLEQIGAGKLLNIFKASSLRQVLLRSGDAVGTEGLTEYLQAYPEAATNLWAEAEKEGRSPEETFRIFLDRLGETHSEGLYSAAVAAPFGALGGAGKVVADARTAGEPGDFIAAQKRIHASLDNTKMKRLAPDDARDMLHQAGLTGSVALPARDLLSLYERGVDIATPLGWSVNDVRQAASLGRDMEAGLADLHVRLDSGRFDAVAGIMRPAPEGVKADEAGARDGQADADESALAEHEAGPANALGVPLSRVTRIEGNITKEEMDAALAELAGKDLPNLIEGVTAQVNAKQKRKLESKPAGDKSLENGFSRGEHRGVAAQIANAWKWAAEAKQEADKNGMPDVNIRRFVAALNVNGRDAFAWLTIKETPKGLRIYSVELMGEKKLRDIVDSGTTKVATDALHRSFKDIIRRLAAFVKE